MATGKCACHSKKIVSMACIVVWQLANAQNKDEIHFRDFLIRLSGKQIKKS
tara:strand:- start:171 stop:323 length:153 start_codon:yes stop_codon:yes gene_type:complete